MGGLGSPQGLEGLVGRLRTRLVRLDLLLPVVGGVSLLVYALHGLDGKLTRDVAVYGYAGQQFIEGVPPYEGVMNRAGPLAHMIPGVGAAGARLFGLEDLTGMRILFLLLTVACGCVTYLFARDLFGSRAAGLAAAFAFLTFEGFIDYASNGPREKTTVALFLLCSLWAAYKHRWFASGAWLSLATLTLQIAFPVGFVAILVQALALGRGERVRALARTAVGGL
ncbi:MAG: glycosyltransferase family 39 protein, partial [Actinomycetia bacterium]|nr:glycosyltransferase family 39 protein [Actinomycetes bacterium]